MKTINLLIILVTTNLFAQKSVQIEYEQQNYFPSDYFEKLPEDTREQLKSTMTAPIRIFLTNNGAFSICSNDVDNSSRKSNITDSNVGLAKNLNSTVSKAKSWILKDFKNDCFYELKNVLGKSYYVKDKIGDVNVVLSNKRKKIDKFDCKLAYVLSKKNQLDTIKYWYTQDIPIIDGPFRSQNIPGLILGYEQKNRTIYARKIIFFDEVLPIISITELPKIYTADEFKLLSAQELSKQEVINDQGIKGTVKSYKYD